MVSALLSGPSDLGSSPGRGHSFVFLGKTLYSHSATATGTTSGVMGHLTRMQTLPFLQTKTELNAEYFDDQQCFGQQNYPSLQLNQLLQPSFRKTTQTNFGWKKPHRITEFSKTNIFCPM